MANVSCFVSATFHLYRTFVITELSVMPSGIERWDCLDETIYDFLIYESWQHSSDSYTN